MRPRSERPSWPRCCTPRGQTGLTSERSRVRSGGWKALHSRCSKCSGKPVECHRGHDGAVAACRRLRALLGRDDVTVRMPPEGFKDVREYLTRGGGLV